jgi:hypothetical protein
LGNNKIQQGAENDPEGTSMIDVPSVLVYNAVEWKKGVHYEKNEKYDIGILFLLYGIDPCNPYVSGNL